MKVLEKLIIKNWKANQYSYQWYEDLRTGITRKEDALGVVITKVFHDLEIYGIPDLLKRYSDRLKREQIGHEFIYQNVPF